MDCEDIRKQLSPFVDGILDEGLVVAVEAHLAGCDVCRAEKEALVTLDAAMTRTFRAESRRAHVVAERVLQQWDSRGRRPSSVVRAPRSFRPVLGYLVAGAAGFLIAVGLFQPWRNDGRPIGPHPDVVAPGQNARVVGPSLTPPVAHLVHATGDVSFRPPTDDLWVSVSRDDLSVFTCPSESRVKTERGSQCELETSSGNRIRLNESCEVILRSNEEVELVQGQISCRTAEDGVLRVAATAGAVASGSGRTDEEGP